MSAKKQPPKTQRTPRSARVWTYLSAEPKERGEFFGHLEWYERTARLNAPNGCPIIPALVVPEAAVKGCEHTNADCPECGGNCRECGSYKDAYGRWQRPRILRVAR